MIKELLVGVVFVILIYLLLSMGYDVAAYRIRRDAIKNNVAEWVVVDYLGNTEFRWITNNVVDVSLD